MNPFMSNDLDTLKQELDKAQRLQRTLKAAFETLKKAVANTLYGAKKIVQLALLAATFKWFGLWPFVILFGGILLIEVIQMGYEKVLEIKPEDN